MELTKGQEQAIKTCVERYRNKESYTVISGFAGTGKAQPIDTPIPTPNGTKLLGNLRVGDYVFDRLGNPTKVLGVFPQGVLGCYKVTLSDGRVTYCNDEHLWTCYTSRGNFINKTLKEMIEHGIDHITNNGSRSYVYSIPISKAIEYSEKEYEIDPYVIGSFIGNGCCLERQLTISSNDEENVAEIAKLIGAKGYSRKSVKNYNWNFSLKNPISNCNGIVIKKFQTKMFFKNVPELLRSSSEKRIPRQYFYGSIEQRLKLVQGLMDTDGHISKTDNGRYNVSYTSVNYNLIHDIQELLFSLGYVSRITKENRTTKYTTGACYCLRINISNSEKYKLFRLSRKKNIAIEAMHIKKRRDYDKTYIVNVEKMSYQKEMVCIYVDNPEHLYLTNDYIVTHNTTIVKYITEALSINEDDVVEACFTGKGSLVLRNKGHKNAITLHKLLYIPVKIPNTDEVEFIPREVLEYYPKLIVVDECSMVSKEIFDLLLSHKIHVIFLGDHFQLPAISESANILDHPHAILTEITRQALDSPIIRLSMDVRNMKPLSYGGPKEARIMPKSKISERLLLGADICLCGRNETRHKINKQIRQLKWGDKYQDGPLNGDKLICLKNYWKITDVNGETPLVNGMIGEVSKISTKNTKLLHPKLNARFISETGEVFDKSKMNIDYQMLTEHEPRVNNDNWREFYKVKKPLLFDYANCVTVHKFQGSQADKVFVFNEVMGDKEYYYRWLYTSITRSVLKCVVAI